MAWYWKLLFGPALAFVIVRATMAAMAADRVWNTRTVAWLVSALALLALMGAVTYYYHVYEPADEDETDSRTSLSKLEPAGRGLLFMGIGERNG